MSEVMNKRDIMLLYAGIAFGAVMGVFGSIFSTWLYESEKGEPWFLIIIIFSAIVFYGFLFFMAIIVLRYGKQLLEIRKKEKKENVELKDSFEVVINKRRGNANFEIKHDGSGKETMTITSKDENGKEIKIELPWETMEQLRKDSSQAEKRNERKT